MIGARISLPRYGGFGDSVECDLFDTIGPECEW